MDDEQLKLIAFDIATQYLMDKSSGKATPMTQLIQAKMMEMRDEMQAKMVELETANRLLRQRIYAMLEMLKMEEAEDDE